MTSADPEAGDGPRERIVAATAALLAQGGREAVSTRAVSAAAGVQAPTLYRLFGDKQGLLDAVAAHGFQTYLTGKTELDLTDDPVQDLRVGWDLHVGFGLANPALYALMYAEVRPGEPAPAAVAAAAVLSMHMHRIAQAGRLRVSEERAVQLFHAAGSGVTLTLIAMPAERRDLALSHLTRDAILDAITTDAPARSPGDLAHAAVTLGAQLSTTTVLSRAEQDLLREWLQRITDQPG